MVMRRRGNERLSGNRTRWVHRFFLDIEKGNHVPAVTLSAIAVLYYSQGRISSICNCTSPRLWVFSSIA